MAKNILQDIVPPEKRSIRNIPLPARKERAAPPPPEPKIMEEVRRRPAPEYYQPNENVPPVPPIPPEKDTFPVIRKRSPRKGIWIVSGIAALLVFFALLSLVSGAVVTVRPYSEQYVLSSQVLTASSLASSEEGLPFEIIKVSADLGTTVEATGEEDVERKASGVIIIYNDFDANEQRLIKNTRFETPEGLIYRINESIVVPGQTTVGNATIPGSIEVTVYADEAGESYNIGLKDFTIPGFAGDPARFTKMYARSKTPMTGGFIGKEKVVEESALEAARTGLREDLEAQLRTQLENELPEGYLSYADGTFLSFESLPQTGAQGTLVTVNERGTLSAVMFSETALADYVGEEFALDLQGSNLIIANAQDLDFTLNEKETFAPDRDTSFSFTLTGTAVFLGQIDEEGLKANLAGKNKKDFNEVLASYPSIADAQEVIRPFWKRSFPNDPQDITIKLAD